MSDCGTCTYSRSNGKNPLQLRPSDGVSGRDSNQGLLNVETSDNWCSLGICIGISAI